MTADKTTDYLRKARELRDRRLAGTPQTASLAVRGASEVVPSTVSPAPTVKGTRKHALITTPDRLAGLASSLEDVARVALDLETTGLDPRRDRVRLLTLATEGGTWIVDCFELDPRPIFSVLAEKELIIHNALFDLGMLSEVGFELSENAKVIDTMLLSQMLEGLRPEAKE